MAEHPWKFKDPNQSPSRKGLLLSNEIEKFCEKHLLIESGFDPAMVRPASYTLLIGPDYVDSEGHIRKMGANGNNYFYMEPNSIVYVSTAERLNLPFYIAARFNLRVKWVYKGILLGTGPQVDPGFRGNLSCPLFNLTNRPVRIKLNDLFATIDFERTSDFCNNRDWDDIKDQFRTGEEQDEIIVDGERFFMFKQKAFTPLKHLPDYDIVSSLVELSKEVKTWRYIGIAAVVAFISLALTMLNFQSSLYRDVTALTQRVANLEPKTTDAMQTKSNSSGAAQPALGPATEIAVPKQSGKPGQRTEEGTQPK
jgi:deoxycytidine triphosphate deaminase